MHYSENAKKAYENLYLVCDKDDNPKESIEDCHSRVAGFLANSISHVRIGDSEYAKFKKMLDDQMFRINTPAMVNAGVKRSPILCACFPAGTLVTTKENGLVPIENIKTGENVLTHKGRFKKVKNPMMREYKGPIYNIKPTTIDCFEATNEHPIYIIPKEEFICDRAKNTNCNPINNGIFSRCYNKKDSYKNNCEKLNHDFSKEIIWKNAEDVQEGDHLILTFNNKINNNPFGSYVDLSNYIDLKTWNKDETHIWFHSNRKTKRFVKIDDDFLLLFGYFAAEGTNTYSNRIGFTFNFNEEQDYINQVSRIIQNKTGVEPAIRINEKGGEKTVMISRKPLHEYIANEFGKSTCYDFTLPNWLMELEPEFQRTFLIGFLRGDGHLAKDGSLSLSLSNQQLAHQIWELFLRQGIITNIHEKQVIVKNNEYTTYQVNVRLNTSNKDLVKEIWPEKPIFLKKGEHSHRRGYFIDENKIAIRIKEVEVYNKNLQVYNLAVEDDHTYTVRNIIVHNCFIIGLEDDMDSIIKMWESAARIYEGGGGCGIPITNLREANAPIKSGGFASGPLSYLRVIQSISDQVKSGGRSRRAANLASYDCYHPDAFDITRCKNDKQSFQAINLSMLVDDYFMQNIEDEEIQICCISPSGGPTSMFYSKELWDEAISNAWNGGDPGLLFYDRLNEDNPTPSLGDIRTTNPCGEVPEMPWTACVLGHWNLNKFLNSYNTGIDWDRFRIWIYWGVLMLNRIIDKTAHPNKRFEEMMSILRPIGMGFMGLADILYKMRIPYGSGRAKELVGEITNFMTKEAFKASHQIAKENLCPTVSIPDEDYNTFSNFLEKHGAPITDDICNTQVTCIAPTGSTSISADCSYGFEPHMALVWEKTLSDSGEKMYFVNPQFLKYCYERGLSLDDEENKHIVDRIKKNKGSIRGMDDIFSEIEQNIFTTAHDISPKDRIDMQAAAQENITMSISSTVNLPNSATEQDVAEIYKYAWKKRLKGITIYRDGSLDSQPVSFGESDSTVKETAEKGKKSKRERPKVLKGETHKLKTGSGTLYLTVNEFEGQPFEVFATIGNSGRTTAAKAESLGRMTSLALRSGVSVEEIVRQLEGIGGDYQIFQEGTLVKSIPDGIALILKRYLNGYGVDKGSGDYTATWEIEGNPIEDVKEMKERMENSKGFSEMRDICPKCGQPTLRHDSSCRGGECINPECMFSNCS